MANKSGFGAAFAKARKELGAGKNFTYNGKSYSTNQAGENATAAPASSKRPMAKPASRPAAATPVNASQPRRAAGTPPVAPRKLTATPPAASSMAPSSSPRPMTKPAAPAAPAASIRPRYNPKMVAPATKATNAGAAVSSTQAQKAKERSDKAKAATGVKRPLK